MKRKREESGDLLTESEVLQKHALLHALLERKTMTLNQCKELTKKLTGDEENFFKLIGEINRDLKLMKMKVKMVREERTNKKTSSHSLNFSF